MIARLFFLALTLSLTGCDLAALLADPKVVQREADAKAIGGACRYAMRSIEDCYILNEKASKSLVFMGWKDMDQYMRDNKIEGVPSVLPRPAPATSAPAAAAPDEEVIAGKDDKADSKGKSKSKVADKPAASH